MTILSACEAKGTVAWKTELVKAKYSIHGDLTRQLGFKASIQLIAPSYVQKGDVL